jgi:hypothetical protein
MSDVLEAMPTMPSLSSLAYIRIPALFKASPSAASAATKGIKATAANASTGTGAANTLPGDDVSSRFKGVSNSPASNDGHQYEHARMTRRKSEKWSSREDYVLMALVEEHGNQWRAIGDAMGKASIRVRSTLVRRNLNLHTSLNIDRTYTLPSTKTSIQILLQVLL